VNYPFTKVNRCSQIIDLCVKQTEMYGILSFFFCTDSLPLQRYAKAQEPNESDSWMNHSLIRWFIEKILLRTMIFFVNQTLLCFSYDKQGWISIFSVKINLNLGIYLGMF